MSMISLSIFCNGRAPAAARCSRSEADELAMPHWSISLSDAPGAPPGPQDEAAVRVAIALPVPPVAPS
jgi:hypothetical protein